MEIKAHSVEAMLGSMCRIFAAKNPKYPWTEMESRNGPVLQLNETAVLIHANPRDRVLLNPVRNANPFFHLYEAMWMLAGRNDVESLKYFVSTIGDFSDDGVIFNGAYGDRWRNALCVVPPNERSGIEENDDYSFDQIEHIIEHLKEQPFSRRAVLQMWEVQRDLQRVDNRFNDFSKDVCCNLSVVFQIYRDPNWNDHLNITVFNRSNDLIWGALGANMVQFSFLQEYVATKLGINVGTYYQVSANLHLYTERHNPAAIYRSWADSVTASDYYVGGPHFDEELQQAVTTRGQGDYENSFFACVFQPMMIAFDFYKEGEIDTGIQYAKDHIKATDWRTAAIQWLERRNRLVR